MDVITQQPTPVSAPADTVTNLAVTVTGINPSCQWYKDTVAIPNARNYQIKDALGAGNRPGYADGHRIEWVRPPLRMGGHRLANPIQLDGADPATLDDP